MHALTIGAVVNALSGVLMIGLGIFVASVKGGARWNRYFALFAVAFGLTWMIDNLTRESDHFLTASRFAIGATLTLSAIGLLLMASSFPEPLRKASRRSRAAVGAILFIVASWQTLYYTIWPFPESLDLAAYWSIMVLRAAIVVFLAGAWGALFLFAIRYGETDQKDSHLRGLYALMSTSLILYFALFTGNITRIVGSPPTTQSVGMGLAVFLLITYAVVWGLSLRKTPSTGARWIPVLAAGLAFIGFLLAQTPNHPGFGISRTVMVAVLAYAIVRHQLLGIDVKVRWTISKTTLAGIFVAVFFVASEVAQQFFGERLGGPYVGIIAAGLLVFAIAPLSRFADRVAERAIPLNEKPGGLHRGLSAQGLERAYSAGVRAAMRDGVITRREERYLAELADNLGIPAAQALRIREQIEQEEVA